MFLLKIMKKLLILFLISLFYNSFSINLLADDYTISSNSTSTNGGNAPTQSRSKSEADELRSRSGELTVGSSASVATAAA